MKMKSIAILFGGALIALATVSCDSRKEQIREEAIENRADSQENAADAVRQGAENAADAQENAGNVVRENAEKRADELEEAADRTREKQ